MDMVKELAEEAEWAEEEAREKEWGEWVAEALDLAASVNAPFAVIPCLTNQEFHARSLHARNVEPE